MTKIELLAVLMLVPAAAGHCSDGGFKSFPAAGLTELVVETGGGPILASGAGKGEVLAAVTGDDPEKCSITMKAEGSRLLLRAEGKPRGEGEKGFWGRLFGAVSPLRHDCRAGFRVSAPPALRVSASAGSGNIQLAGFSGAVSASAGSGEIALENLSGAVAASAGSGRISGAVCAGDLRARTGSGPIEFSGLCGPASARAGSGDIRLEWAKAPLSGAAEAGTGSGNITLLFPEGSSVGARLASASGRTVSEFSGEGGFRVSASAGSGDVSLLKAK